MRYLSLIIISAIVFFLLFSFISLFFPSSVTISKAVNVYAKIETVWPQIDGKENREKWNPLEATLFKSEKPLELIEKTNAKHVYKVNASGKNMVSGWQCLPLPASDSVVIQWYVKIPLRWYPWEKFSSLLFEKRLGVPMQQGLDSLKATLHRSL